MNESTMYVIFVYIKHDDSRFLVVNTTHTVYICTARQIWLETPTFHVQDMSFQDTFCTSYGNFFDKIGYNSKSTNVSIHVALEEHMASHHQ